MASGDIMLSTDYSSIWEKLNKARTRLGVPAMEVPSVTGSSTTSKQMKKMESDIEATRVSDSRISSMFGKTTLEGIEVGDITLYNVITTAKNVAIQYQGVPICTCQGHQSDHNDNDRLQQCGCWGDDGCSGDEGGCEQDCGCWGYCDAYDGEYIRAI